MHLVLVKFKLNLSLNELFYEKLTRQLSAYFYKIEKLEFKRYDCIFCQIRNIDVLSLHFEFILFIYKSNNRKNQECAAHIHFPAESTIFS